MPLKLSAVSKRVVAQGAGEVLLVLLMAVLDVLLQRCQTLVAPVAVGAGQQLGEGIWRSRWQVCTGDSGRRRRREEEGEGKAGQKVSESMATNGRAAQSGMGVISAICSTWESQCQAGIRCTTTSSRLTHSTPTRSHFPPHSYKHVHGTARTHYSTDSPNFFKQPSFSSPPTPNHHRWHVHRVCSVNHNPAQIQAPLFQFFPSGELQRCAIWFQAPAQLLLKTVGKHPGIRRICGTNSCPVVSARRLFFPLSFLFFFLNICWDISWASTLSYCSSYAIRVGHM